MAKPLGVFFRFANARNTFGMIDESVSHYRTVSMPKKSVESDSVSRKAQRRINKCVASRDPCLNLGDLGLTRIPHQVFRLTWVKSLYLINNKLTSLPPEIHKLVSLESIFLNHNRLTTLPPEIALLTNLEVLNLDNNLVSALPREICNLRALRSLYLQANELRTLPSEIGNLTKLEALILEGNSLRDLPRSLVDLPQLKHLSLHGNETLGLPTELLGPTWGNELTPPAEPRAILDYYFSLQFEGEEPMREVRLLLVGRGRVGKTSLLKTLRDEFPDKDEPETPGICVLPLEIECTQGVATGHVWDFGGQEFLHGTHQIFLAERCVYLLVLEGRESNWETETDYWIRFIQSFGGDSPVVVVLNKYDEHPFSVDQYRLRERCPQIVGFIETDAFTGRGIRRLMSVLAETVDTMRDVWLPLPKNWHNVKETVTGSSNYFFEFREYQELCNEHGVDDAGTQNSLAQTLHRLGIALNFRDHHRLRHTTVLKPEWVTEAIYGLIRYVQQKDCHGVLKLDWMINALDEAVYPQHKHAFVLELMEKFEVAFALEGTESWLIPELLREEQPEEFEEFRGKGVRRLRFTYPEALPPGLLPRLIVRTHEMSAHHPEWRWRSGVVLHWGKCRALVRLNRMERRTEVAVIENPIAERQSLFDLIRAHMSVLHGKVRVIEEAELDDHPDSWVRVGKLRLLEEKGTKLVDEVTREGDLATVKVIEALDGVESSEARRADWRSAPLRCRLFICYAHDDAKRIAPLSTHLTILGQRGYIQHWQDTQLVAGEEWKDRILEELDRADIILLLYSTACRASQFIQKDEGPKAIERVSDKADPVTLIVAPLDREDWDEGVELESKLKELQTATWNSKPILRFRPQRDGWLEVEHAICGAVKLRRSR